MCDMLLDTHVTVLVIRRVYVVFICVTWLMYIMCDMTHGHYVCGVHMCDMTHVHYVCGIHMCDMTHLHYVWHDSCTLCVTWLMYIMCDMTHLHYVWHDSCTLCVTWLMYIMYVVFICVTWLMYISCMYVEWVMSHIWITSVQESHVLVIHMCDMTHVYQSFICVTWLIPMCNMICATWLIPMFGVTHSHTTDHLRWECVDS